MGTYTNLELTAKGLALEAKVQAGATLVFSRYGLGSGALTFPDDVSAMTALVNEEMSHPIAEVKRVNNTVLIKGYITPDDLPATGFDLTEIGIFATDPDDGEILFGLHYGTAPDNIPSSSSGMNFDYAFNTEWVVQQTDTVTVYVDPTAGATKQDLIDHEALELDPTDTDMEKEKHLSNAQGKKWEDHVNNTSVPHVVTQKSTRQTTGTWTITGLTIGIPLYIGARGTGNPISVEMVVAGGSLFGTTVGSSSFILSSKDGDRGVPSFVLIPGQTTVEISVVSIIGNADIFAWQT